jgi:hypothetical protein
VITKRKYKKTQGVGINYCASTKKSRRSQCIVSSSFIMGKCHQIFKSLIYVSKKHISENKFKTKTELAIQIFSKFENFIFSKKGDIKKFIVLIDGVYTNSQIIKYIESSGMKGYIGRYSKGRNIFYNNKKMLLKEYISSLSINDFSKINLNENEKYIQAYIFDEELMEKFIISKMSIENWNKSEFLTPNDLDKIYEESFNPEKNNNFNYKYLYFIILFGYS